MDQNTNELRRDIKELGHSIRRDIKELEHSIKRNLKEFEQRMLIKLGALMVATIGIIVALSNLNVV